MLSARAKYTWTNVAAVFASEGYLPEKFRINRQKSGASKAKNLPELRFDINFMWEDISEGTQCGDEFLGRYTK